MCEHSSYLAELAAGIGFQEVSARRLAHGLHVRALRV